MEEENKSKINHYVDLYLKDKKLPFTYSSVTVLDGSYTDDDNFFIELLFNEYNGGKYPHRNRVLCEAGTCSQIMYLDRGYPSAALEFDREMIPEDALKGLARAAFFSSELTNNNGKSKNEH